MAVISGCGIPPDMLSKLETKNLKRDHATLTRALEKLQGGKTWGKGDYRCNGKFCTMGAVGASTKDSETESRCLNYLSAALPDWTKDHYKMGSILWYNDEPNRKFNQIRNMFRRAIRNIESKLNHA